VIAVFASEGQGTMSPAARAHSKAEGAIRMVRCHGRELRPSSGKTKSRCERRQRVIATVHDSPAVEAILAHWTRSDPAAVPPRFACQRTGVADGL